MKIKLTSDVKAALARGRPVVALESTIIAHGMPYPQNYEMAKKVETIIRDHGATPATIAIVDGTLRAGLSDAELEHFAKTGPSIMKVSVRDLPYVVSKENDWRHHGGLHHAPGRHGGNCGFRHRRHGRRPSWRSE